MFKILLTISIALILNYSQAHHHEAVAVLKAGDVSGTITFTQTENGVQVKGTIKGLTPGEHGFHIHEKGNLSDGCASTGGHFNPMKKHHGAPSDEERHIGDLGNIVADNQKVATIDIIDKVISLDGPNCIVGRAVVVHADRDDLGKGNQSDSLTTGHAGARVACAIIGIA